MNVLAMVASILLASPSPVAGPPAEVSRSSAGAFEASVATFPEGVAVAWYDTRAGYAQIYARFLDANGQASSDEMQLTHSRRHAYEPDLQLLDSDLLVAWYDKQQRTGGLIARVGRWTADGQVLWQKRLSRPDRNGRNPVVRQVGERIFCAWLESARGQRPWVWTMWLDRNGRVITPARKMAPASRTTWNLNAAIDPLGRAWVVYDAHHDTRRSELFLLMTSPGTTRHVRLSSDDGFDSVYPDVALEGSRVALTWFDERDGNSEVYLLVDDWESMLANAGDELPGTRARRITHTPGNSIGAYVAWNGTQGGLGWCDDSEGQYELYFEPFDASGLPSAPPTRLTYTERWSMIPSITPWREGFALAWNEYQPSTGSEARSAVVLLGVGLAPRPPVVSTHGVQDPEE